MASSTPIRPRLTLLDQDHITQVHEASLRILSSVGVRVDSEQGRQILDGAPGVTWEGKVARIPPELIERALETAPSIVDIYDQRGEFRFSLGVGEPHFGVGVTALEYQDPETDETVPLGVIISARRSGWATRSPALTSSPRWASSRTSHRTSRTSMPYWRWRRIRRNRWSSSSAMRSCSRTVSVCWSTCAAT